MKKLLLAITLLLTLSAFGAAAWGATYYVSQSGTGDGSTVDTPDSVADFNAGVFGELDGDTVYLLDTITSPITIPDSGTAGSVVTLRGDYTGKSVTISGATGLASWSGPDGNGEYSVLAPAGVDGGNALGKYIFIKDGVPVDNAADDSEGALGEGQWCLDKDTSPDTVYYKPRAGETFAELALEFGKGTLVDLNGQSHLVIQGLSLYGGQEGFADDSTAALRPTHITITDCDISNMAAHGISLYAGDNITVGEDPVGCATAAAYSNRISYCQKGGVKIGTNIVGGSPSEDQDGNNCIIIGNYFYRNAFIHAPAYSYEGHQIDISPYGDGNIIQSNFFAENGYCGGQTYTASIFAGMVVSVDGADDFSVTHNRICDNYQGALECGPDSHHASTGGLIAYNIICNNGRATPDLNARLNKLRVLTVKNLSGGAVTVDIDFHNNVVYDNQGSGGVPDNAAACIYAGGGADASISGFDIKNNIFYNNDTLLDLRIDTAKVTFTENNNLWYRSGGGNYMCLDNGSTEALYPSTNSFAEFVDATGGGDSLNLPPRLLSTDFTSSNFLKLRPDSPCVDAGTDAGLTTDYAGFKVPSGRAPDIGAYEYRHGSVFVPGFFRVFKGVFD